MSNWFKRNGIHLAIIGIFITLCFIYFSPALKGKSLRQGDVLHARGGQKEIMDFKAKDGKAPLWTNSMFGGMPAYQVWAQYPKNVTTHVMNFLTKALPNPIYIVLLYLLGAYLLFCVLRMNPWLAAAGAIAFAFSSYNFILIEAGHANQALAIAFFAPVIAGILLILRGKHLQGAAVTAFFVALEIRANHIQMTYYLLLAIIILLAIELYHAIKGKALAPFVKSMSYLAVGTIIAIGVNAGSLWTTYEYGKESQRGKSNLTSDKAETSNGLSREYAYGWSQGVGENITFLVPNAYGGASGSRALGEDSKVVKVLLDRQVPLDQAVGFAQQTLPAYWGEKAFTSGPFYFGAIICFLYILGLFIVKDRIKWWIFGATLLTLFLSFGKNFPLISDIFFDYFPLYNKFRTVESILAVAGLLFPMLAILAVKEIAFHKVEPKELQRKFSYTLYITGGLLLIIIALPTLLLTFKSSAHEQLIQQITQMIGGDQAFANAIANALVSDRESLARTDALRSLAFLLVGAGLIWGLIKQKIKPELTFILLALAILVDMWSVDRRYLNNENFMDETETAKLFEPRQVDQLINRDTSLGYRVFDLSTDPFSSVTASYFHRSLGGYHAAKLKRYQEVIEKQFGNSINEDILDMLNTKYVITSDKDGQSQRIQNRETACGNAWFVPTITYVKGADQEMQAINSFDPHKEAFVEESFKNQLDEKKLGYDPNGSINLISYHPDHLVYEYSTSRDMLAVFAEIWYDKGWKAYMEDGKEVPIIRANYLLRAAELPGGNHKIEFKFEPASYYTGETISLVFSIILGLALIAAVYAEIKKKDDVKVAA